MVGPPTLEGLSRGVPPTVELPRRSLDLWTPTWVSSDRGPRVRYVRPDPVRRYYFSLGEPRETEERYTQTSGRDRDKTLRSKDLVASGQGQRKRTKRRMSVERKTSVDGGTVFPEVVPLDNGVQGQGLLTSDRKCRRPRHLGSPGVPVGPSVCRIPGHVGVSSVVSTPVPRLLSLGRLSD